jgi:hypothetical protein
MTTTREVKVMALHRFDWTRKGAANARDYRHDLYPDGDFEYGEEDLFRSTTETSRQFNLSFVTSPNKNVHEKL